MMLIELSWPAKQLSPNHRSRSHWPRTRALKAAKMEGFVTTLAAMMGGARPIFEAPVDFLITAYPPDKRARDDDNVKASCKAQRDGIAKALGIDDRIFAERFQWGEPVKGGKIVICIGDGQ